MPRLKQFFFKISTLLFLVLFTNLHTLRAKTDSLPESPDLALEDSTGTENASTVVYVITIDESIMPGTWRMVEKATNEAVELKADVLFFRINTYGGLLHVADSIRTRIMDLPMKTIAWIDNNAASAGALISISCDHIFMTKGANIGAASVVDQSGEKLPDKYQSYMRGMMRSTAEAKGRDPKIAEAMVDERIYVSGVSDTGYILTFTTSEAIKHGYCDGQAESFEEVMKVLGFENYEVKKYEIKPIEKIISFLLSPMVNSILLLIIIGGLYFELQTPGVGFPIVASIVAAVLYFAPLYLEGLAENWEILLFVGGILLIAVEIFVLPGFGVAGVAGILLAITGLTLSLVGNVRFDFSFTGWGEIGFALFRVTISMAILMIMLLFTGKGILNNPAFRRIALVETGSASEGYTLEDSNYARLVGQSGVTITPLRPAGKVEINGERHEATADNEFIEKGIPVEVIRAERSSIIVRKANRS